MREGEEHQEEEDPRIGVVMEEAKVVPPYRDEKAVDDHAPTKSVEW